MLKEKPKTIWVVGVPFQDYGDARKFAERLAVEGFKLLTLEARSPFEFETIYKEWEFIPKKK